MKSGNEITTIGTSEVEVIKHRIYEVRDCGLKSQFVISSSGFPICESNTRFAVKNFDRKTDLWSKQLR